jgi:hypothetical protein
MHFARLTHATSPPRSRRRWRIKVTIEVPGAKPLAISVGGTKAGASWELPPLPALESGLRAVAAPSPKVRIAGVRKASPLERLGAGDTTD